MRVALISDIHANLDALEAVLADAAAECADEIVCLGDVVGYGPEPNACVDRVRACAAVTLIGNHDQAALGLLDTEYFNEYARAATDWTAETLTPESRAFLTALPLSVEHRGLRLVHASPVDPEEWAYILTLVEARRQFSGFAERLCFLGHSHLPIVLEEDGADCQAIRFPEGEPLELLSNRRYIVNVGSVGQPRDRDPRAAYVIFDDAMDTLELRRVEYPVFRTQEKILREGLPQFLATRLANGM